MRLDKGARLDWFCFNLEPAGTGAVTDDRLRDPLPADWPRQLPEILALAPNRPDIVFLQGARRFDADGDELLLAVERQLGWTGLRTYRGFLSVAPDSDRQQIVYVNTERIETVHHWRGVDPYERPDRYGFVEVIVDSDRAHPVLLKSIDLGFDDGIHRMAQARRIQAAVGAGQRAVIAGCFTRGVLAALLAAGWCEQHTTDTPQSPAAPHDGRTGELVLGRCLTTPGEAITARAEWVNTSDTPFAHYRVLSGVITITEEENAT